MDKFTKIITTIGPACDSEEAIGKLYEAGMNIVRLNFSHGSYDYFTRVIKNIRNVSDKIAILLDTKGPEIRSGEVENNLIMLKDYQELIFTKEVVLGNEKKVTINYEHLDELEIGNNILIDDGLIETEVIEKIDENSLKVKVLNSGILGSKKTISIRGHNVDIPFLSEKDMEDIKFGIENNVDFIAASFVRKGEEVKNLRKFLDENSGKIIKIISKIEHGEAIENIEEIIEVSNGIMVARGDLGVEMPLEKVPMFQRDIIKKCNELGRPVIVATQMLESMKENPRPTRAEVADIATAIIQGTDAIMLSGETASGKYPILAVETMKRIAKEYDSKVVTRILNNMDSEYMTKRHRVSLYVTKSAYEASKEIGAAAILAPTESGFTARKVSRFKPQCPIYAITHNKTVLRQLQLSWGVFPMLDTNENHKSHDSMVNQLVKSIYDKGFVKNDEKIVVTSGHIMKETGHTNMLEIYTVENILDRIE